MGKGFESAHYQIDKWDVIQGYWNILNVVGKQSDTNNDSDTAMDVTLFKC